MDLPKNLNSIATERVEGLPAATTSINHSNPVNTSHNMNDLKMLDFNSADEVRQAMKVMLGGKKPQNSGNDSTLKPTNRVPSKEVLKSKEEIIKHPKILKSNHAVQNMTNVVMKMLNTKERRFAGAVRRKRPGRPPKAGPSKRAKKASVTFLYIGKLSNVVPFKHTRTASGSESDDYLY